MESKQEAILNKPCPKCGHKASLHSIIHRLCWDDTGAEFHRYDASAECHECGYKHDFYATVNFCDIDVGIQRLKAAWNSHLVNVFNIRAKRRRIVKIDDNVL